MNWNFALAAFLIVNMGIGVPAAQAVDTQMVIDTTNVNFGNVNVGNTSSGISVTLTNSGPGSFGPINIFGGAPPTPAFNASQNCQGATLANGASCMVTYTFSPTSPGSFTDSSNFTISQTASQAQGEDFVVSLAGVGVNPITGTPLSHNFGNVNVGSTSAGLSTVITNNSAQNFGPINIFGGAPPNPAFNASQNCQGATLAPSGTCSISYTFSPTAPGIVSDVSSFTISATSSQASGVNFNVSLTGCGTVAGGPCLLPDITVAPSSLNAALLPNQSSVQTLVIGNVGAAALNWTIAENNATAGACVSLPVPWVSVLPAGGTTGPGGSSSIDVTFNSAGLAPGTYQARLCIDSNDPDEAQITVALTLVVVPVFVSLPVPTLSPLALVSLAGLLALAAAFLFRRRRKLSSHNAP